MVRDSVPVYCIFCSVFLRYGKTRPAFPSTDQLIFVLISCFLPTLAGCSFPVHRQVPHKLPLVQRLRPRHVRHASAFRNDGPHRSITPRGLLRTRKRNWRESPDRALPLEGI